MREVHTEITLKNGEDLMAVNRGLIKETEVRQLTVNAVVDTGAWTLVMDEATRAKLGLEPWGEDTVNLADGGKSRCMLVGPLEVWWKNRKTISTAVVLPRSTEVLLGAIPMEGLDIIVNPREGEVVGAHGDQIIHRLY